MKSGSLVLAAVLVLLAGCASQSIKRSSAPAVDAEVAAQSQASREHLLREQKNWALTGRVALSNGRQGGSGRIEWQQDGARTQIALSAPVTRQGWRLTVDDQGARIEGLEGGPRTGSDATALLQEATGWVIPAEALGDWVRGIRAEQPVVAGEQYDAQGRLASLEQDGWHIDYRWPDAVAGAGPSLPSRIDATKGEARIKLIVDEWLPPPSAVEQAPHGEANTPATEG